MDTEYVLGCSLELAETTALEHTVLSSGLGAYAEVRTLVDENRAWPEHYLCNTAARHLAHMHPDTRHALALQSLSELEFSLQAWGERLAYDVQTKAQQDLGLRDERPTTGILALAPSLRETTLVHKESDINEQLVRRVLDVAGGWMRQRIERDCHITSLAIQALQNGFDQKLRRVLAADPTAALQLNQEVRRALSSDHRKRAAEERRTTSIARSAIKKAARLFGKLGHENELRLFVSGQDVELSNASSPFKFVLKPLQEAGWLVSRTQKGRSHTPYELSLLTKDDVFLANLCVYFDDTPVLDQLLALTLFIQSGDELKVLEKANWFGLQDWSERKQAAVLAAYPGLAHKLPQKRRTHSDALLPARPGCLNPAFDREHTHWAPYKGPVSQWIQSWMEPLHVVARPLLDAAPQVSELLRALREPVKPHQDPLRAAVR